MCRRIAFWFLLLRYLVETLCDEPIIFDGKKDKEELFPYYDADTTNAQKPDFLYVEPEDREEEESFSYILPNYIKQNQGDDFEIPSFCSFWIDYSDPNSLTTWSVVHNSSNYSHPVISTDENSSSSSNNHNNVCSGPEKIIINPHALTKILITNDSNAVYFAYIPGHYFFKFTNPPGPAIKCTVRQKTINQDIIYEDLQGGKPRFVFLDERTCNFILFGMISQTAGDWEFTTYYNDTTNSSNTIRMQRHDIRLLAIPGISNSVTINKIKARRGEYKIISIDEKDTKNATCKYFDRDSDDELTGNWAKPYGKCGMRLAFYSKLKINIRIISGYTVIEKYYNILESDQKIPITKHYKHWKTGSVGSFELNAYENKACELVKPDGINIKLESPQCNYTINNVSSVDRGTWTARYYLIDNTTVDVYYIIYVWESRDVWITVDKTENSIDLVCRMVEKFENCTFQKLENFVNKKEAGKENVNYLYPGTIRQKYSAKEPIFECARQISLSNADNYGMWKCSMGNGGINIERNFTIQENIKEIGQSKTAEIDGSSYVEIGDKFQIKCPCNGSLKYCMIKSPSQVTYSVLENKTFSDFSGIIDTQITFNDCGITIHYANHTHSGRWMREFSFNKNTVFQTNFMLKSVYIESNVSVAHNTIQTTNLTCSLFPNDLHFKTSCSWNRPNGHGILEFDSADYTSERSNCELRIHALSPEDRGNWTCYAKLKDGIYKTFSSIVELKFKPEICRTRNTELPAKTDATTTLATIASYNISTSPTRINEFLATTPSKATFTSADAITTLNVSSTTVSCISAPARKIFMSNTSLIANGEKVDHCEWIHPNGSHLIQNDPNIDKSKYIFTKIEVQCQLELKYWNNEDYGRWECCVYLTNNFTNKVCNEFDFFENSEEPSSPFWWIITAIIIVCIAVCVGVYYYRIYKMKKLIKSIGSLKSPVRSAEENIYEEQLH